MFENRLEEVLPAYRFWYRLANSAVLALAVVAIWLFIGMLGYHFVAGLPWIDAFLNAAMILSGMGPVDEMRGNAAKLFAGTYALLSGVVFLSTAAILFAPLVHRLLHHFHRRSPADLDESGSRPPE
ncbi:MAG: hypothetical protein L0Y44_15155 [Phycisphaerales bacterium]|nr:hypothetical protein [Phycisphaerales bacterium]MCI0675958.1 hypothetical protein [Phycisphaerales bacterium]